MYILSFLGVQMFNNPFHDNLANFTSGQVKKLKALGESTMLK